MDDGFIEDINHHTINYIIHACKGTIAKYLKEETFKYVTIKPSVVKLGGGADGDFLRKNRQRWMCVHLITYKTDRARRQMFRR